MWINGYYDQSQFTSGIRERMLGCRIVPMLRRAESHMIWVRDLNLISVQPSTQPVLLLLNNLQVVVLTSHYGSLCNSNAGC